jgi:transporter family protein
VELFYALFGMFCWGLAPLFGKLGLYNVNPVAALTLRTTIAFLLVTAWNVGTRGLGDFLQIPLAFWIFIAIEALLATLVGDLAYFVALKHGNINDVTLIMSCSPLITMVCSFLFLAEVIYPRHIFGAILIISGLICINWK